MVKNKVQDKELIIRRLLSIVTVALMVFVSFSVIFIEEVKADDGDLNQIDVATSTPGSTTVGYSFYSLLNAAINYEVNNVTITNITFEPAGLINYTNASMGNMFSGGNWWTPDANGTVSNAAGYAYNLTWIGETGVNGSTYTVGNISWHAINVGTVYINITGVTKNDTSGVNFTKTTNETVTICPGPPTGLYAAAMDNSRMNISFNKGTGADNTVLYYNTSSFSTPGGGTLLANITGNYYVHTGLTPGQRYYYLATSWNSTENLVNDTGLGADANEETFSGGSQMFLNEFSSSISNPYVMNGSTQNMTFNLVGEPNQGIHNVTVTLPDGLSLGYGGNGTTQSGCTITNTSSNSLYINATSYPSGMTVSSGTLSFWVWINSTAALGTSSLTLKVYNNYSCSQSFTKTVFTTTNFSYNGTIKNATGVALQGALANITVQSMGTNAPPATLGYFTATTNVTGHFNITNIPSTQNVSTLGPAQMGPGGIDENSLFYSFSCGEYNDSTYVYAMNVSASLPSLPVAQLKQFINEPEVWLKPAVTFNVTAIGPDYDYDTNSVTGNTSKSFELMVKDQALGFPVKEFVGSSAATRIFSVAKSRNYTFTMMPNMAFPISLRFNNIFSVCQNENGNFNMPGVNTTCTEYNGTYCIKVIVNTTTTNQDLTGFFNGVTNPTAMRIVAYTMEDDEMIFESWALPHNIGNMTGNGLNDAYNISTNWYRLSLPATQATSYIMLRAYAQDATGYYMGSELVTAASGSLSTSTLNFTMNPLTGLGTRNITSNNCSNQWNEATVVTTKALQFNFVNTAGALLSSENSFVDIKQSLNSTKDYKLMIDAANGTFSTCVTTGTSYKELTIYSQSYAPVSVPVSWDVLSGNTTTQTINCTSGQCNITLRSFGSYDPLGENASMTMGLYRYTDECAVPNPPDSCDLCGNMDGDSFSPLTAILKGDVSMMISTGNISVFYFNTDLLASGPPDAAFSTDESIAATGLEAAWKFGSQGPEIYNDVLIKVPYSSDLDNKTINISIPLLYDNEFNIIWNSSAGDTISTIQNNVTLNTLYGDYINTSYEAYLNGTGVTANETDSTLATHIVYRDTDNRILWMKIPHFSGIGPNVGSNVPGAPTSFSATTASSSSISLSWTRGTNSEYTRIQRNTGSAPTSISTGTNVYNGTGTSKTDTGLSASTAYYYSAWAWDSDEKLWSTSYATDSATTSASSSSSDTSTSSWTPSDPSTTSEETEEGTATSNETVETVNEQYNTTLEESFYGNDTDGDGVLDTFTDPNGELTSINVVEINGNASFLLSSDADEIPEFFWDTKSDIITPITHSTATVTDTTTDEEEGTVTVTIEVEKPESEWLYIEITDGYPDMPNLEITTSDGRTISDDMIWREDGKIYVLDDPSTEYIITYSADETSGPTETPTTSSAPFDYTPLIIVAVVVSLILLVVGIFFKTGYLYFEKDETKKPKKKEKKPKK